MTSSPMLTSQRLGAAWACKNPLACLGWSASISTSRLPIPVVGMVPEARRVTRLYFSPSQGAARYMLPQLVRQKHDKNVTKIHLDGLTAWLVVLSYLTWTQGIMRCHVSAIAGLTHHTEECLRHSILMSMAPGLVTARFSAGCQLSKVAETAPWPATLGRTLSSGWPDLRRLGIIAIPHRSPQPLAMTIRLEWL